MCSSRRRIEACGFLQVKRRDLYVVASPEGNKNKKIATCIEMLVTLLQGGSSSRRAGGDCQINGGDRKRHVQLASPPPSLPAPDPPPARRDGWWMSARATSPRRTSQLPRPIIERFSSGPSKKSDEPKAESRCVVLRRMRKLIGRDCTIFK
jgi:hypothetical protein